MEAGESGCTPSTELIILNDILKSGPRGSLNSDFIHFIKSLTLRGKANGEMGVTALQLCLAQ